MPWLTQFDRRGKIPAYPSRPRTRDTATMYGWLIAAACVLFSIAGVVLYLHDHG